jgi:predicted phage terminase large subunit-like protein
VTEVPQHLVEFAFKHRVEIERELGARSFYDFFRMAWNQLDPVPFIDNWHIKTLCDELQLAAERVHRNMVIAIPPRCGKSLMVSVAFPAWVWSWWPSAKFITASYDIRLATRDAVACRRLVQCEWYQSRWGHRVKLRPDQDQKTYFETTAGGHRFVTSPSAGVTGHGADFIIADDPHNVKQAESEADRAAVHTFWFEAIPTRLNRPSDGVKIVIQQRIHEKDLAGECMRRGFRGVVLPMRHEADHPQRYDADPRSEGELLWPARIDPGALKQLETELGSYAVAGQLQQRPAPRAGGMFKRQWFRVEAAAPAEAYASCVRKWDLAATTPSMPGSDPDWTAGVKMGRDSQRKLWVLDVARFRATPSQVENAIRALAGQDGNHCTIGLSQDPGQAGVAQIQYLTAQLQPYNVRTEKEMGDKTVRADPFAAQCEAGNVILVRGDWNEQFIEELCAFPNASHDDVVDGACGAFRMLNAGTTGALDFMRMMYGQGDDTGQPRPPTTTITEAHDYR